MKILLKIRYVGTAYCGFQCQKNGASVQEVLTAAAERVFGTACHVTGCSRTDAGVHALGFCCTVEDADPNERDDGRFRVPTGKIHCAFAPFLPPDISVVCAANVPDSFHPRYDCTGKNYIYRMWDAPYDDPFEHNRSWRLGFRITEQKERLMRRAAKQFVGRHDFSAFMASGSRITDTVRQVTGAEIYRENGGALVFSVCADGFLYNMVRIMAGTLADVAAGSISADGISDIIASGQRAKAGRTAPAYGLYLKEVFYPDMPDWKCD